ncbi:MAG: radical SAM protein [Candidatus Woesearchaeota archaeon]
MNRYSCNIRFAQTDNTVHCSFFQNYYFELKKEELEKIGDFEIKAGELFFKADPKRINRKMALLIANGFDRLQNRLTGRPTVYIDRNSGIPLIGSNSFGIVDRNTSLIEVKPVTGCNLGCIFCSVDEGKQSRWKTDFLVDDAYLVEEYAKLALFKGCKVEAHIGTQGEPLLYPRLEALIRGLRSVSLTNIISIDTNGTLLTKAKIDELADAGLTRINLSINSLSQEIADRMAGAKYSLNHVLEMAEYASKRMELLLAPVWVPGINDSEMPKLIELSKTLRARIGIQNMLNYKHGRNPVKAMDWALFEEKLQGLEKEHGVKLLLNEKDFAITKTRLLPKPFKKGDIIKAGVVCDGRLDNEKLAVAQDRNICVKNCSKMGEIRIKIIRDKHNIFLGK